MRTMLAIALASVLIFGYGVVSSMADEMMQNSAGTPDFHKLSGASVDVQGKMVGKITDLLSEDGVVTFAVVDFGNYRKSGKGEGMIAVPFGILSCASQGCTVYSSYENLETSPVYIAELIGSKQPEVAYIYSYFGLEPYWEANESNREMLPE